MYYTKQLLNALFLVAILFTLLLLGIDYYLLSWHEGSVMDWMVVPLRWLEHWLIPLRVLLIGLMVAVVVTANRIPRYRKPGYQPLYVPPLVQGIALIVFLVSAYGFSLL